MKSRPWHSSAMRQSAEPEAEVCRQPRQASGRTQLDSTVIMSKSVLVIDVPTTDAIDGFADLSLQPALSAEVERRAAQNPRSGPAVADGNYATRLPSTDRSG